MREENESGIVCRGFQQFGPWQTTMACGPHRPRSSVRRITQIWSRRIPPKRLDTRDTRRPLNLMHEPAPARLERACNCKAGPASGSDSAAKHTEIYSPTPPHAPLMIHLPMEEESARPLCMYLYIHTIYKYIPVCR